MAAPDRDPLPEIKARLEILREGLLRHGAAYDAAAREAPTDLAWLIRELEAAREIDRE